MSSKSNTQSSGGDRSNRLQFEESTHTVLGDASPRVWHQFIREHDSEVGQISDALRSLSPRGRFEFLDKGDNPRGLNLINSSYVLPALLGHPDSDRHSWFGSSQIPIIKRSRAETPLKIESFHLTRLLREAQRRLEVDLPKCNLHRITRMPNCVVTTARKRWSQRRIPCYSVSPHVAFAVAAPLSLPEHRSAVPHGFFDAYDYKRGARNKHTVAVDRLDEVEFSLDCIARNAEGFDAYGRNGRPLNYIRGRMGASRSRKARNGLNRGEFLWSAQMLEFFRTGAPVPWIEFDSSRFANLWDEVIHAEHSGQRRLFIVEGALITR